MQRRFTLLVDRIHAGARFDQPNYSNPVTEFSSVMQRRFTLLVDRIHAGARLEQRLRDALRNF